MAALSPLPNDLMHWKEELCITLEVYVLGGVSMGQYCALVNEKQSYKASFCPST